MEALLDLISYSDKRKNLLILLQDGPKTLDEIKTRLNVTATGMLPQIRKLEEGNLVKQVGREYLLTELGDTIASYFKPLIKTMSVIEDNYEFWTTHDLKAIPQHLLRRINELGKCRLIKSSLKDWFDVHEPFIENLMKSKWIVGISPAFHPEYPLFFRKLGESGIPLSLIFTKLVFERLTKDYSKEDLQQFLELENVKIFVSRKDIKIATATSDCFFSLSLFFKDGSYDSERDLYSFEPSAIKWGRELFEHYLKDAEQIKSL